MRATLLPSLTKRSALRRPWSLVRGSARGNLARCLLTAAALAAGCQSPEASDPAIPLPPTLNRDDLLRYSKRDFQQCTAYFYKDDWNSVATESARLLDLAQRWAEQQPPAGKQQEFQQAVNGFTEAAKSLRASAQKKDVVETTMHLRRIAQYLAVLERPK